MAIHVTVVGARDRQPEELLRAAGLNVSSVGDADLASLSAAGHRQPDALVVDLRGAATVPPALTALKRQHPSTGIVIIASSLDPGLLVEAMRAGVNEVVPEPFGQQDLERAVSRVTADRLAQDSGDVFAFIGAKGGVGATTIAVNVGTMLGKIARPRRALLIDLHYAGGDGAVFTGAEPRFSVLDAVENINRLDQSVLRTMVISVAPATDLLAAPERPAIARLDSAKLKHLLSVAAANYKYAVLDLPRSDGAVLDALESVKTIYIVANQELATVRSASRLATMLRQRYGRDKVGLVISRSDRQADIGHADVEKAVGLQVAYTFPSDYRVALQALNTGRPLALDNHNDLSSAFHRFACQIAGVKPEREHRSSGGLFGRFTQRRG